MHILVIDDDPDQRLLIARKLAPDFPDLKTVAIYDAKSFEQALSADRFDLVITDYQLHWSNGLEVLQTVKNQYPDCPVIMFTDTGSQEIAVEAMKRGLDDYILKSPKHYVRLVAAVKSALERVEQQRRARLLEFRLQFLLNELEIGVFRMSADQQLLEGNSAFLQLLGVGSLAEVSAPILNQLWVNQQPPILYQRQEQELYLSRPDGSGIWVLLSTTPTMIDGETVIDGLLEDITSRKQSEEVLKRYAKRLKTLQVLERSILQARSPADIAQLAVNSAHDLIHCQFINVTLFSFEQQRATVLAVHPDNMAGFGVGTRFNFEELGDFAQLQQNQKVMITDLTQRSRANRVAQSLLNQGIQCLLKVPLMAEDQLIGALNIGTIESDALTREEVEITDEIANQVAIAIQQAHLREELQHYTEQLEQEVSKRTQRLLETNRDLEAFTYSVSHDLREPLRALQGYAEILLEDHATQLDADGQTFANRILTNAERMNTLVRDLLAYSRLSRADLALQPINLSLLVQEVLTQLELPLQQSQAQVTVEEPLQPVQGHYLTVVQVVTNLLTNAIKFVEPDVQPQVRIRTEQRDRWVRLWIEDNGIGIEPQYQERIFHVFERLHNFEAYPGTGIGLAIVRKGIERMGGQGGLESTAGQGSRFWVELPLAGTSGI